MFCTYCNIARPDSATPCPNCGAPSPFQGDSQVGGWGAPGASSAVWGDAGVNWNQVPQQVSPSTQPYATQSWAPNVTQPGMEGQPLNWPDQPNSQLGWLQYLNTPSDQPQQIDIQRSLVPVPPQQGLSLQPASLATGSLQATEEQIIQRMLPAIPDEQSTTVYVPPMYTSPRAIIPKYRIISGLMSVIIVMLLLCTGAGFYAKASGQIDALQRFYGGGNTLKPINNTQANAAPNLPDPPQDIVKGPAYNIIPSATTARRIDDKMLVPIQPEKNFKVGETIYLTYSVKTPNKTGKVNIKWYMNNLYYGATNSDVIDPKKTPNGNGKTQIIFVQPAEGYAELYWNDQLAQRLYFVVRP